MGTAWLEKLANLQNDEEESERKSMLERQSQIENMISRNAQPEIVEENVDIHTVSTTSLNASVHRDDR